MPSLFNQGSRPLAASSVAPAPQTAGRPANAPLASASGKAPAPLPVVEGVPEQLDSVRLSAQALASRSAAQAGEATIDVARRFTQQFAAALFGKDAKGASLDFDNLTLSTSANVAASASATSGADGVSEAVSLSFDQSAHFVGIGQLTLQDGRTFNIEVEVNYQASVDASASQETEPPSPDVELAGKHLPAIKYPGGIEDLFKLLGRELSTQGGDPGKLTLRLMRLVDRAALLAPRLPAEEAKATRQQAANAYASTGAVEA